MEKLTKSIITVGVVTALILMVPFVAMQFTPEVDWSLADFIIMGGLIFGTGLSFVLIIRFTTNIIYRLAIGLALGTTFFMIYANLAVGLIASGPNIANLSYIGVIAVTIIGSISSRFNPGGMERAMYTSALAVLLVAVVAFFANIPGSSVKEIVGVNGFFAALYAVSGSLFRFAGNEQSPEKSKG